LVMVEIERPMEVVPGGCSSEKRGPTSMMMEAEILKKSGKSFKSVATKTSAIYNKRESV
jgi:hypothetical protein